MAPSYFISDWFDYGILQDIVDAYVVETSVANLPMIWICHDILENLFNVVIVICSIYIYTMIPLVGMDFKPMT